MFSLELVFNMSTCCLLSIFYEKFISFNRSQFLFEAIYFTDSKLISYWGTFSFFVVVSLMKSVKNKETTFLCCKSTADAPI